METKERSEILTSIDNWIKEDVSINRKLLQWEKDEQEQNSKANKEIFKYYLDFGNQIIQKKAQAIQAYRDFLNNIDAVKTEYVKLDNYLENERNKALQILGKEAEYTALPSVLSSLSGYDLLELTLFTILEHAMYDVKLSFDDSIPLNKRDAIINLAFMTAGVGLCFVNPIISVPATVTISVATQKFIKEWRRKNGYKQGDEFNNTVKEQKFVMAVTLNLLDNFLLSINKYKDMEEEKAIIEETKMYISGEKNIFDDFNFDK